MKAILGRLTDLGVRELFWLLTSAGAAGELEVESAGARTSLQIREGYVAGEPTAALIHAVAARVGTFCFHPGPVPDGLEWFGLEEFLARIDSLVAQIGTAAVAGAAGRAGEDAPFDPLAELRHSLAEVPLPGVGPRLLVITADPRPYRALEPEWRQRGWDVALRHEAVWAEGYGPSVVVVHLPTSATLAGQGGVWLDLVRRASKQDPPAPVIWVGGLADPWLRHQAVVAGAEFLMPAPAGEVGESARWFREDLTAVAERLLARRESGAQKEAAAFRDFFLAMHADASPGEVSASLLRFAGSFFARALLLAVRDSGFDALGGFGFAVAAPSRLPRGTPALEHLVVERRPASLGDLKPSDLRELAAALGVVGAASPVELFPVLRGGECVAVLLGHEPLADALGTASLASLLARSGSLLGL
jgi:hypothetical protein